MKISDLEFHLVQIDRSDSEPPVRSLLVCLSTDFGDEGWGEAPLPWRVDELSARREALLPALSGRNVFDIEELLRLDAVDDRALASALEMASWDLIGRVVRQPLFNLFGGSYRQRIPLAARLPGGSAADAVRVAREMAEHGFHAQIVTATGNPNSDAALVRAVAEAAADRAEVRVDGAGRYDVDSARRLCSMIEDDDVRFLLDPLPGGNLEGIASLARLTSVPLAISQPVTRPKDVMAAARAGAGRFVVVDPARVAGLSNARKSAVVADAAGMSASLGGRPSVGVAVAATVQLAAACPCFASGNECSYHQLKDDVLADPLQIIDGLMAVPQTPGLGVRVDRAKLERYQAR